MKGLIKNKIEVDNSKSAPGKGAKKASAQENSKVNQGDEFKKEDEDAGTAPELKPIKGSVDEWSVTWP